MKKEKACERKLCGMLTVGEEALRGSKGLKLLKREGGYLDLGKDMKIHP